MPHFLICSWVIGNETALIACEIFLAKLILEADRGVFDHQVSHK